MPGRPALALLALALVACGGEDPPEAPLPEPPEHTPRWAFEPWISKDISDRADTIAFVEGFRSRDIPVGAVVLDSPWDSHYTTFLPNPTRYPDFGGLVDMLHAMDIRVILWTTQMVNRMSFDLEAGGDTYRGPAENFVQGVACGFFAEEGQTFSWWKGQGAGVDFFDPRARAWWHGYQNRVLDLGIDGWKLDFGESYMEEVDPLTTDDGEVSLQAYSEAYYRDFLAYGVSRRGRDFTTMVRGWDRSYDRVTRFFARPEHAPVVWAGDNRRDWVGLEDALETMLRSAAAGYVVVGSDIGGYLDRDDLALTTEVPFNGEAFDRWVPVGAMNPFMQLHGRANLAPWTVPERVEETVAIYRYWSHLHHAMVPFWYSLAEARHASPALDSTMTPIGTETEWDDDYRYTIGDAFLVAPLVAPGGIRDVALPAGASWYDWWAPEAAPLEGGEVLMDVETATIGRVPLYVRSGAIIPMDVENDVVGVGRAEAAGHRTLLVFPDEVPSSFTIHEVAGPVRVEAERSAVGARVTWDTSALPVLLRVRAEGPVTGVQKDGAALTSGPAWSELTGDRATYWVEGSYVWIRVPASAGPTELVIAE
jgi:alpha-glucosidase (family GH31 glycosyl hydrolase)